MRPTYAEINLSTLRANIRALKKIHEGRTFFCPMVKADAYGHGDIEVSKSLIKENVKHLGVILVEEGIRLRENKIGNEASILVFGYHDKQALLACEKFNLTPVIGSFESLNALKEVLDGNKKTKVHLKFNSGMSRLGFQPSETSRVLDFLDSNKNIDVEGICTHFANGDDATSVDGYTFGQMKIFSEIEKRFTGRYKYSHCLNSAALVSGFKGINDLHANLDHLGARPGIAIYGYPNETSMATEIHPVMSLKTSIVQVRTIAKGDYVSYGATWKAQRESVVATLCIGYGDGYPRNLSNHSPVLFRGTRVPVIGRVCMDYTMIDLTDFRNETEIKMGEEVTMWGYQDKSLLGAEELAQMMSTISYELITRVGKRVPRVYIDN